MNKPAMKPDPLSGNTDCPTNIGDSSTTLTVQQIFRGILQSSPQEDISIVFPNAVDMVKDAPMIPFDKAVKRFSIRNGGTGVITLMAGTGGDIDGVIEVRPSPDAARFALRYTCLTTGQQSYKIIRE